MRDVRRKVRLRSLSVLFYLSLMGGNTPRILADRGASDVPGGPSCENRRRRALSRVGASSGSPAQAVGERAVAAAYAEGRITAARIAPYFAH